MTINRRCGFFVLTGLGMWGNPGGEVEDCWLEIAARAGS